MKFKHELVAGFLASLDKAIEQAPNRRLSDGAGFLGEFPAGIIQNAFAFGYLVTFGSFDTGLLAFWNIFAFITTRTFWTGN